MRIAVVGGGVIGLSVAWRLAQAGARVTLFDSAPEAREASWAAAGMLAPHHEASAADPVWRLGVASLARWQAFAEELGGAAAIDLRMDGGLLPLIDPGDDAELAAKRAFLTQQGVPWKDLDRAEVARCEPALAGCQEALLIPAGQVNPRRLTAALRNACARHGVDLRYGCVIDRLPPDDAELTVLAAGAWTPALARLAAIDLVGEPVKGQLLRFAAPDGLLKRFVHCHHAYLVPRAGEGVVVGSTMVWSGFDKTEDSTAIECLADSARQLLPALRDAPVVETWTGLRPRLRSGLPLLQRVRDDLVIATGHFRNGILLTPITADAVRELCLGIPCGVALEPYRLT